MSARFLDVAKSSEEISFSVCRLRLFGKKQLVSMSKMREMLATSPRVRGLVALLAIIGAFISPNPLLLAAGLMLGILPVVAATGLFTRFIKFVLVVILPIALGLFFVWGWLVAAPPGEPHGSAPIAGCVPIDPRLQSAPGTNRPARTGRTG
jgi:hypothetical protein